MDLPYEIYIDIFCYLDTRSIITSRIICKSWNTFIADNTQHFKITLFGKITDAQINIFKNVQIIYLYDCHNLTDNAFINLQNIHTIKIINCQKITADCFKYLHNVRKMTLMRFGYIYDQFKYCGHLQKLIILYPRQEIEQCLQYIDKQQLKSICIFSDFVITRNVMKSIRKCVKINLSGSMFNDDSFMDMKQNVKYNINLNYCLNVVDDQLKYIPNTEIIKIKGCDITDQGLKYLVNVKEICK